MKFTFTCKKVPLNDSIKEYAEKKISKLDRFFPKEADAFVTFAVEKKNRCTVEVTIKAANGTLFRAQEQDTDGDMRGAIDAAVAFIDRRIRKNKTRLAKNLRTEALTPDVPAEFDVAEDVEFNVVRTKRFALEPMTIDEAILQMNLLDHPFYMFRNADTQEICVVYQRKNGGYGLIVPEA
jgi:putative sigma-54 modulation protein